MTRKASTLEALFDFLLRVYGPDLPVPEPDYLFHPTRKFEIDRAWQADKFGVELQGQIWVKGGHSSGRGLIRDYTKHNEATRLGWRLLYFSRDMLERDPEGCIEQVRFFVRLPATDYPPMRKAIHVLKEQW